MAIAEQVRCCTKCGAVYRNEYPRCVNDGAEIVAMDHDPLLGSSVGSYLVDALIGEGGMGRVYRAHHVRLAHKRYALKVLLGDLAATPPMRLRFAKEAESASRLAHPNTVGVIDFGVTETGLAYMAMDLVEGRALSQLITREPMAPERVVRLARQLCAGLGHAHALGLIHRDFKPDNVIVVEENGAEVPRIADFGLAISNDADETRLTVTGFVMGTPGYVAPEQCTRGAIDHRADLYALGVTMFEMLSGGVLPFDGGVAEIVGLKVSTTAPTLAQRAPHVPVPPALAAIVDRLLARKPESRYPDADAVIEALDAALGELTAGPRRAPDAAPVVVPGGASASDPATSPTVPVALDASGHIEHDVAAAERHDDRRDDHADERARFLRTDILPGRARRRRRTGRVALASGLIGLAALGAAAAVVWSQRFRFDDGLRSEPTAAMSAAPPALVASAPERSPVRPDTPAPDHATADTTASDVPAPDHAGPDTAAPDTAAPDTAALDTAASPGPDPDLRPRSRVRERARRPTRAAKPTRVARATDPAITAAKPANATVPATPPTGELVVAAPAQPTPHPATPVTPSPTPEPAATAPPPPAPTPQPVRALPPPPPPKPVGAPKLVGLEVRGALPHAEINRALDRVLPAIRACRSEAPGIVEARFTIGESRRATGVRATGLTPAVSRCVTAAIRSVRTESPPDVGDAHVEVRIGYARVD